MSHKYVSSVWTVYNHPENLFCKLWVQIIFKLNTALSFYPHMVYSLYNLLITYSPRETNITQDIHYIQQVVFLFPPHNLSHINSHHTLK